MSVLAPVDDDNIAQFWLNALSSGYEVHISNVETQNFTLFVALKDSSVPKALWQAMEGPKWAVAIDKELTKFEADKCFTEVPFVDQHLVPMTRQMVLVRHASSNAVTS